MNAIKKIMEEVIIKPVGSQHILFALQRFYFYACEGFIQDKDQL